MNALAMRNTLHSVCNALRKAELTPEMDRNHVRVRVDHGEYRITTEEGMLLVWWIPTKGAPARLGRARSDGAAAWAIREHLEDNK